MKRSRLILCFLIVIITAFIVGCTGQNSTKAISNQIAGVYEEDGTTWSFAADGTLRISSSMSAYIGSWYLSETDDNSLVLKCNWDWIDGGKKVEYELHGDEMDLFLDTFGEKTCKSSLRRVGAAPKTVGLAKSVKTTLSGVYQLKNARLIFYTNGEFEDNAFNFYHGNGEYKISGNDLTLNYSNGEIANYSFEWHEDGLLLFGNYDDGYAAMLYYGRSFQLVESLDNRPSPTPSPEELAYQDALSAYQRGNYEDALSQFSSLGSYEDSEKLKADCQQKLDLESISKIAFLMTSKESDACLTVARPASKPTMEFKFGMDIVNRSTEDIRALSLIITIKDGNNSRLMSFNVSSNSIRIAAERTEPITMTHTLKDYASVTMNDIAAHLMDLEDYTIEITVTSIGLGDRKLDNLNDTRIIQTAKKNAVSQNIIGTYREETLSEDSSDRIIVLHDDGTIDCIVHGYDEIKTFQGVYSVNGFILSISFDRYLGSDDHFFYLYDLASANEYRLVNNRMFVSTSDYGILFQKVSDETEEAYQDGYPGGGKQGGALNPGSGQESAGPIGILVIQVDALRIRQTPSTSADETGMTEKGEVYEVLAIDHAEGYTWYMIGQNSWVADKDGKYGIFSEGCRQVVFVTPVVYNGSYFAAISVSEWTGVDWEKRISGITASIGSNGTTTDKHEGDHCTPSGTFNILFCFSDRTLETGLRQKTLRDGDVWVTDQNSRYYNTIQSDSARYKDWTKSENIYRQLTSGRSVAGIFFDYNGDGETAGSATPGAGAALFLDGVGSNGNLYTGYGDIKLTGEDLLQLLKVLDSTLNPVIIIDPVN